eukprot:scaffold59849_cov36-Phaeocystis_antarctica.AAC.1
MPLSIAILSTLSEKVGVGVADPVPRAIERRGHVEGCGRPLLHVCGHRLDLEWLLGAHVEVGVELALDLSDEIAEVLQAGRLALGRVCEERLGVGAQPAHVRCHRLGRVQPRVARRGEARDRRRHFP